MASRWRTDLASGLVEHGVAVVSGGPYGIDGAAHRAALAAKGATTADMAGGYVTRIPVRRRVGDQPSGLTPLIDPIPGLHFRNALGDALREKW